MGQKIDIKKTKKKLKQKLKLHRVNSHEELKPPEIAWGMLTSDESKLSILGTLGNFSLIIGKAKSRKSFFISMVTSVASSTDKLLKPFQSRLPKGKGNVLYFDTEQGKYHVQLALKRICKQINITNPKNLYVYGLRSLKPKSRLNLIEYAIYNNDKVGFIVIDGIKDLITSINSEEEATEIASKLLKWTEERNIHIVCVLHQNKGDTNARGHLGSELTHKAETVLSVTKSQEDKSISIVEAEMCRNEEPDTFAFEIINGIPIQVENFEERTITKKKKYDILDIPPFRIYQLLTDVFSKKNEYKYAELMIAIKAAHKVQLRRSVGNNAIRDLMSHMKNMDWLLQETNRGSYKLGEYKTETE